MKFEVNDMKVLAAVAGGNRTFKDIRQTSNLDKRVVETILGFLEQSQLIGVDIGKGFLGDKKYFFFITSAGGKYVDEYIKELKDKWNEILAMVTSGERGELDEYMKENKFLVNMMLYFKIVNLPALSRLNLRFLIEGKHLCYKCKKELTRFSQKFSVSDCRKRGLKMPKGLTTHDDLCADCFDGLPVR
tara:strand:- start:444 stop:1007 length:564 start_codon:yes stop_codon:yes gene_type:complete